MTAEQLFEKLRKETEKLNREWSDNNYGQVVRPRTHNKHVNLAWSRVHYAHKKAFEALSRREEKSLSHAIKEYKK